MRLKGYSAAALFLAAVAWGNTGDTFRASVSSAGIQGNDRSPYSYVSGDGRYVLFASAADNLVPNDTDNSFDCFVYDRLTQTTQCVSVDLAGKPATGLVEGISADGRYALFNSSAPLVADDTNNTGDFFVRDLQTQTTERVSVTTGGAQATGSSQTHKASISADGRYVVFSGYWQHMVPGDTNNNMDVYVRDRQLNLTERVSVSDTGAQGNANSGLGIQCLGISGDGRYVAFLSLASNLITGDTNGQGDVYLADRTLHHIRRVSVTASGQQANSFSESPRISRDGRFVVYDSEATNLVPGDGNGKLDVYTYEIDTHKVSRISLRSDGTEAIGDSRYAAISGDGRMVIFYATAKNLIPGDPDSGGQIFMKDTLTGVLRRVSVSSAGISANNGGNLPSISDDGTAAVFASTSTNLVSGDTNATEDIFEHVYGPAIMMSTFTIARPAVAGQNYTFGTVTLDNPAADGGARIFLSDDSDYVSVPSYTVVLEGSAVKSFQISTFPTQVSTMATIVAQFGSQQLTAPLTVIPLVPSAFEFTPSPVVGGVNVSARLVLNGVTGPGGLSIMISDDSAFATTAPAVTAPAGASQVVFNIPTLPVTATQYVTVTASVPQGSKTGLFVIRP